MTKDELKDELKNRISMALKNPILQQGFEIICRENDELKERADKADLDSVLFFNQLCKAKAIIKDYKIVAMANHCEVCSVPEENRCINVLKLNEQAEQFLRETEK